MSDLDSHVAIRMEHAFDERPRDERYALALEEARAIYRVVLAAHAIEGISYEKVIAEYLLEWTNAVLEKRKREYLLEAQQVIRGCVATAERHLREAMQKANTLADRLVE